MDKFTKGELDRVVHQITQENKIRNINEVVISRYHGHALLSIMDADSKEIINHQFGEGTHDESGDWA
jgi:hypothetical protein